MTPRSTAHVLEQQHPPPGEHAERLFMQRLAALDGVLDTDTLHGEDGSITILVYVACRLTPEADRIYDLKLDVLRQYPDARLDIWVAEAPAADPSDNHAP